MPTVIDTLIVKLQLDTSDYDDARKKVDANFKDVEVRAVLTAKQMESRGKQAATFFSGMRNEALKLFAVITGGAAIKSFVTDTIKSDAAVGRLAKSLGMATEELSAWQGVAQRTGGTKEGITDAIGGLVQQFQELQLTGNTASAPYLQALGLKREDLDDASGALLKISDALAKMDPRRARSFGQALGFDPETINLLMRGRQAVEGLLNEQRKLGVVTRASADAAQAADQKIQALKQSSQSLGRTLLLEVLPTLQATTDAFTNLIAEGKAADFSKMHAGSEEFRQALADIGGDIDRLMAKMHGGDGSPKKTFMQSVFDWFGQQEAAGGASLQGLRALAHGDVGGFSRDINRAWAIQLGGASFGGAPSPGAGVGVRSPAGINADQDLAIRTMIAEARRGDTQGQRDVAHVILNRQRLTGKSAGATVREHNQFQPWNTAAGRAKMARVDPYSPEYLAAAQAWSDAVQEQKRGVDPTGGATHFYSPSGMVANIRDGLARGLIPNWTNDPGAHQTLDRGGHRFYAGVRYGGSGRYAAGLRSGAAASSPAGAGGMTNVKTDVQIDRIEVVTRATDARGIADAIGPAVASTLATQANTGMN